MRVRNVFIDSIGTHIPERMDARQAVQDGDLSQEDFLANDLTGVPVAGDTAPPDLAVRAVQDLFEHSEADPAKVSLVLYATGFHQGPDGWSPVSYIQSKTIGGDAPAVEVRGHCTGAFTAMMLAAAHLQAGPDDASVLVVGAENFSRPMVDRWSDLNGMALGDAAVAVLLRRDSGFARLRSVDVLGIPQLEVLHRSGEPIWPPAAVTGHPMDLRTRSAHFVQNSPLARELKTLLIEGEKKLLKRSLADAGLSSTADISFIGHINAGRAVVVDRLLPLFGMTEKQSTYDLGRDLGHLGIADQLIGFRRLLEAGRMTPGQNFLMAGVGPGLHFGTAIIELLERPDWTR